MIDFELYFQQFFARIATGEIEIYNEISLQHEVGIYFRSHLSSDFKIQFERPVSFFGLLRTNFVKKEIDIAVFTPDHSTKYAIELKYPGNGQYPEQMFKACQDMRFLEQLHQGGFTRGFFLIVADDPLFYDRGEKLGIYNYFRRATPIHGIIPKPTGKSDEFVELEGYYSIVWQAVAASKKYALVAIP
ncbi:MAG: hypothetical protein HC875_02670 [Anaerolineales bacterium]|nr:hypothetical protein [Anaerolineales bacterium]